MELRATNFPVIKKLRSSGMTGVIESVNGALRVRENDYCEYPKLDSNNSLVFEHPEKFGVGTLREAKIAWEKMQKEFNGRVAQKNEAG